MLVRVLLDARMSRTPVPAVCTVYPLLVLKYRQLYSVISLCCSDGAAYGIAGWAYPATSRQHQAARSGQLTCTLPITPSYH